MPLTQAQQETFLRGASLKARETGIQITEPGSLIKLLVTEWDLLTDLVALTAYVAAQELDELKATRVKKQADLDAVDAEIANREGK